MQIRPTNSIQSTQSINFQSRNQIEKANNSLPTDQLEISPQARMLEMSTTAGVRMDRVAEIRTQITQGNYDTPERLEMAINRMFDQIA